MANTCKSCGSPVIWAETVPGGKRIPLDPVECVPSAGGALVFVPSGNSGYAYSLKAIAERIAIAEGVSEVRGRASALARYASHLSHFATCPHSNQHRRSA